MRRCCCKSDGAVAQDGQPRPRKMSFTSASMAMGAFPPERKVVDPIINVAILFESADECPDKSDLLPVVKKVLEYERCAGVPAGTIGQNDWSVPRSDGVDPARLIKTVACECDDAVLFETIDRHLEDSLREGRDGLPWWEFVIMKNKGLGMSSVVFRIEHCLGDGLSLVSLFEHFLSFQDGSPVGSLIPASMNRKFVRRDSKFKLFLKSIAATTKVLGLPKSRFDDDIAFRRNVGISKDMIHTGTRKTVVFNTMPLDFLKALKNAANVTLNDILFTALSQAFHDYSVKHDCPVLKERGQEVQFRALMPVAFPSTEEETEDKSRAMNNKWVFVSADMGVGFDNVVDRLEYINRTMMKLKTSPTAFCQRKVQETIPPRLPVALARQTVFDSFCRHSLVFSNVPGATKPCLFAGKKAIGCQFIFNNLIPQVNMLSYNDGIFMNMVVDPIAVSDCDVLPVLYSKALVSLATHFNVKEPESIREHAQRDI